MHWLCDLPITVIVWRRASFCTYHLATICRMRSIVNHLKQSRDFPRLRIGMPLLTPFSLQLPTMNIPTIIFAAGIGRPPGKMDPANFVLRPFNKKEQEEVFTMICTLQIFWFSQFSKHIIGCSILFYPCGDKGR